MNVIVRALTHQADNGLSSLNVRPSMSVCHCGFCSVSRTTGASWPLSADGKAYWWRKSLWSSGQPGSLQLPFPMVTVAVGGDRETTKSSMVWQHFVLSVSHVDNILLLTEKYSLWATQEKWKWSKDQMEVEETQAVVTLPSAIQSVANWNVVKDEE